MGYYNNGGGKSPEKDIFATWSIFNIIAFWVILCTLIASAVFLTVPLGMMVFLLWFLLPIIWKDPDDDGNPANGMMVRGTTPYKIASFMSILKNAHRSHIFSPTVMWGFGPPEDDIHKGVTKSMWTPPTRISAWWALGFAICLSFLDYPMSYVLFPIWGDSHLPLPVTQVISTVFWLATLQVLSTARRFQLALAMSGVENVPAVMGNKISREEIKPGSIRFVIALCVSAVVILGIAFLVSTAKVPVPWMYIGIGAAVFGLSCGLYSMFRYLTKSYRKEFDKQIERRDFWNNVWAYKGLKVPFFEMEVPVPAEPGKPGGPPPGGPPGPEDVWVATFAFPTNGSYIEYANEAGKIASSLPNGDMVVITPIPKRDQSGNAIPGTVSDDGFRVWWTDSTISLGMLLTDSDISAERKEIAIRHTVTEPLSQIRGINRCLVHSHSMMTAPDSKVHIMKVTLVPPDGVVESDFTSRIDKLTSSLGANWVRAKKSLDSSGRSVIDLYIGDGGPNSTGIVYPKGAAASRYRRTLISVHWEYVFAVNSLRSPMGSPSMMLTRPVTDYSDEIVFDLPAGVSYPMISKRVDDLKTTSGNAYLELHPGVPGEKKMDRKQKRELERYRKSNDSVSQFTAVAAAKHPLENVFYFSQYKDKLITGREKGVAKVSWSPGVKANGTLATHSFASDMAHLVLAGSSGSGKSVLIYSMICQLAANNHPEDLQFWIVDPKIGFQNFQYMDSVTRYVDTWTPHKGRFFFSVRDLLREAVNEMTRRNEIFRFAQSDEPIDKLGVARRVGMQQGPLPDGSPNPLMQPYIIIVIDEVAMLFAGAPDKESKDVQAEILYYASKLARESRSAGIHCLFATQYPTTQSLPSLIKQQSGRIGLKTQDGIASKVIIDQTGLEDLYIKGSGKVQEDGSYFDFRGLLLEDGDNNEHGMMDIINSLPSRDPNAQNLDPSQPIAGDPEFYDIPLPDSAVYRRWEENSTVSTALNTMVDKGESARFTAKIDKLFADMSDEEFALMSLEDFKSKVLSGTK